MTRKPISNLELLYKVIEPVEKLDDLRDDEFLGKVIKNAGLGCSTEEFANAYSMVEDKKKFLQDAADMESFRRLTGRCLSLEDIAFKQYYLEKNPAKEVDNVVSLEEYVRKSMDENNRIKKHNIILNKKNKRLNFFRRTAIAASFLVAAFLPRAPDSYVPLDIDKIKFDIVPAAACPTQWDMDFEYMKIIEDTDINFDPNILPYQDDKGENPFRQDFEFWARDASRIFRVPYHTLMGLLSTEVFGGYNADGYPLIMPYDKNGNPNISHKGAIGPGQIIVRYHPEFDRERLLKDSRYGVYCAAKVLRKFINAFGKGKHALVGYYAGRPEYEDIAHGYVSTVEFRSKFWKDNKYSN